MMAPAHVAFVVLTLAPALTKFTEYSKAEQMPSVCSGVMCYEHDKHLNNQLVQFIHLSCLYINM